MYRNILVAIDASDSGHRALEHATGLARALDAELTVLAVVVPVPGTAFASGVPVAELEADATRQTEQTLREAVEAAGPDLTVRTRLRHGNPPPEIVAEAQEGEHDLVVIGSRGRGRLASAMLGSVAGEVHFHLHVPLLVVHAPVPETE